MLPRQTAMKRSVGIIAVVGTALILQLPSTGTAFASCAGQATLSPSAFTGRVLSTTRGGRIAQVQVLGGGRVEVDGTPAATGATAEDRIFVVGLFYTFSPSNSSSPYQDSICSMTHLKATGAMSGPAPRAGSAEGGTAWWAAPWLPLLLLVPALGALGLLPRVRRYWRHGTDV